MNVRITSASLSAIVALGGFMAPAEAQQPAPAASAPASMVMPAPPTAASASPSGSADDQGLPPPPVPAVLPVVPKIAPGYAPPVNGPLPNADLVGVAQQPFVGLKLDDAIGMALARNTDLAVSAGNDRIANYEVVASEGAYDVAFQIVPQYQHSVQPSVNPLETGPNGGPITQISSGASAGFTGQTTFGTRYSLSASAQSINNDTTLNGYNPYYQTAISLQLQQPLLRGTRGGNPAAHQLTIARANAQGQSASLLVQVSQTITNVADTYWDLVAAWRNVAIQEEGLRNATLQAQSNTRLAQRGAAAPVDVVESNTQINVFQDNVFAALQRVQQLQSQLKSEVLANPADPLWTSNLVPTSAVLQLPAEPKLDDLIVEALRNRPEVNQLRAQELSAASNLAYEKNQTLPQVDLGLGATYNGFAGQPVNFAGVPFFASLAQQTIVTNQLITIANEGLPPGQQIPLLVPISFAQPAYQTGRLGQAWTNLFDARYPSYTISLTIGFPLQNRTAKAQYAIAEEQAKQIAVQEIAFLQRIRAESVNAIQTLRETQYRLAAATAARVAAERVLLSEQRRFNAGTSTTFLVLQRQLDVANTQGRELQAQTDLNKAVDELNRVAGTNFTAYNINVGALAAQTLGSVTPSSKILPLPPDAKVSPPPAHQ